MKKSLIISYNYPPVIGGIETYAFELIKYFDKNLKDFYDFIYNDRPKPLSGILRGLSFLIFISATLLRILFKKYDVIHITNFNLWFVGFIYSLIHRKTKIVINLWGLELVYKGKKGILPIIYNFLVPTKLISKLSSFEFMVSSKASKDLAVEKGFDTRRLHYVPLGTRIFKSESQLDTDDKYVFFAGRITPRKGLNWFVHNVLNEFPDLKLKFVGPIIDKKEYKSIIKSNQVEYLGVVSEQQLINLRQSSLAVVIPNTKDKENPDFEAFCFVTIESVACKAIVIASNYQGLADSLLDGQLGFLAEPSDKSSWTQTLKEVLSLKDEERNRIIEDRLRILKQKFMWQKIFEDTYLLHRKLVKKE